MLIDQKRRLFILASDAHDLFMMTNRIDNAYYFFFYALCGFMVFLDAFPNILLYFLIVFSSNKVLRGILMTSYRPAWCGNYTRRYKHSPRYPNCVYCVILTFKAITILFCLISRHDRRQTNYSLCGSHINWHFFERTHLEDIKVINEQSREMKTKLEKNR